MAQDGAMPQKRERLTFSKRQSELIEMDETGLLVKKFYDGEEFTDRRNVNGEQTPFTDAYTVYEGIIDESKISFGEPLN